MNVKYIIPLVKFWLYLKKVALASQDVVLKQSLAPRCIGSTRTSLLNSRILGASHYLSLGEEVDGGGDYAFAVK